MLVKRTISAVTIIIIVVLMILAGGWAFTAGLGFILAIAAWEFSYMFKQGGYTPATRLLMAGTFIVTLSTQFTDMRVFMLAFGVLFLCISAYHVLTYHRHAATAGIDLAASLAGIMFITYPGSFIAHLRMLPDGMYWTLIAIAPAGLSDIGAFLVGSTWGCRKISPKLSPKKTLEGYLGGILTALLVGWAMGALGAANSTTIQIWHGILIGALIGILCPLGDLAKSLFKRQFDLKDTGDLIPGHGGMLDRIDTALWAGLISYMVITWLLI